MTATTQISGLRASCAAATDGTVSCWGYPDARTSPPGGTFERIVAGGFQTCGQRSDASWACWGLDYFGEGVLPSGTFSELSLGYTHACGVRPEGTVACWGQDNDGQASPP